MNESDPLSELRNTPKSLKAEGQSVVPIDGLLGYLEKPTLVQLAVSKEDCLHWRLQCQELSKQKIEMFRSVMTAAHAALKSALLINGAAAAGILTFVGSLANRGMRIGPFIWAMASFALGVFLASSASGLTYLAQRKYGNQYYLQNADSRNIWTGWTIFLVIMSYLAFAAGCGFGTWGIWSIS